MSHGKDSSLESAGDHSTAITNLNRTLLSMLLPGLNGDQYCIVIRGLVQLPA